LAGSRPGFDGSPAPPDVWPHWIAAVANYLGQADTGATERYLHALDSELWDVARHLEAELAAELPASDDAAGGES